MPWVRVARADAIPPDTMLEVEANGLALLLYHLRSGFYATSAICPHHAAWLSDGRIYDDCIDCPRHMGRFHIATGVQRAGPASPALQTYALRLEDGQIMLDLPP